MSEISHFIYLISDSTGETAATVLRAALVQYPNFEISIVRYKNVRTEEQADRLIEDCEEKQAMVAFTVASAKLRKHLREQCASRGIPYIDLLEPLLQTLDAFLGVKSTSQVGALRVVDEVYFKRIEAIEFTVKHDDGKCLSDLDKADVVLVGISRTSKTPLSIFLSHKGWKVANIPLVINSPLPKELLAIDQKRIVALTIDIDSLQRIRKNRLEKFGQDPGGSYASMDLLHKEIDYAEKIYGENRRWPVFNVTERALEETASEIVRVLSSRLNLPESMIF